MAQTLAPAEAPAPAAAPSLSRHVGLLGAVLLVVGLAVFPHVVTSSYYVHLMVVIAIYAILILGLDIVVGYTGQVSLGHAGLFGVGAQPPRPHGSLGLYHLAWQVDTIEQLEEARLTLANLDALTGESSHGATKSVYGRDPDGNEFEVMWMLPKANWGEYENAAPVERLDLPGEVARWGGVRTAAELVPVELHTD